MQLSYGDTVDRSTPTPSSDLPWREVGEMSGISDYSYEDGVHSIVLPTLGVSNVDLNPGSGSSFTGDKHTFPLTYADGTPVLATDNFALITKAEDFSFGTARNYNVIFGAVQAISTSLHTMDGVGGTFGITGVGTPLHGTWRRNTVSTTSLANATKAIATIQAGSQSKVGVQSLLYSNSTESPTNGLDANTWSSTTQLYGIVGIATLGTVTTTGGELTCKLHYKVVKLS